MIQLFDSATTSTKKKNECIPLDNYLRGQMIVIKNIKKTTIS